MNDDAVKSYLIRYSTEIYPTVSEGCAPYSLLEILSQYGFELYEHCAKSKMIAGELPTVHEKVVGKLAGIELVVRNGPSE
ncbi:hypothetical protein J4219_05080 [Candidatus Woesearchaeota archaeon]|nr:hypothetical protein [Candidatus Woesearchaeota archaeon]